MTDMDKLIRGTTCVVCKNNKEWVYALYSIDLEPYLRKWLLEFADENIEAFQHELKGAKQEHDMRTDIARDKYHRVEKNFCYWYKELLQDRIELLDIRIKNSQKELLLEMSEMKDLCSLLKPKNTHFLGSRNEYDIRQIKMATTIIEIMEKRSHPRHEICVKPILQSNSNDYDINHFYRMSPEDLLKLNGSLFCK